jgi:hypothetical protein
LFCDIRRLHNSGSLAAGVTPGGQNRLPALFLHGRTILSRVNQKFKLVLEEWW